MKNNSYSSLLKSLLSLKELFYPRLCVVCGRGLTAGERFMCTFCQADFPFSDETFQTNEVIWEQWMPGGDLLALYSLFYYSKYSDYKNLIYAVKYRSRKELGVYLGRMLGNKLAGGKQIAGIVPVPLHPHRQKKRGFNQAVQIAQGMAEVLNVEVMEGVVVRVRNNVSQTGKSADERQKNVENIFELRDADRVRGKHILLVDDVITTGATIRECMKVMAQAGGVRFSLACLARTQD